MTAFFDRAIVRVFPYALILLLGYLLLGTREKLGASIETCNAEQLSQAFEKEKLAHDATRANAKRYRKERDAALERADHAIAVADESATQAAAQVADHEHTIDRLLRDASKAGEKTNMPTFDDCLNVLTPDDLVHSLRNIRAQCDRERGGTGPAGSALCEDPVEINPANPVETDP